MNILITICARGGSKGLPKKNIKLLDGKHLIGYSIDLANSFNDQRVEDNIQISLSTDSGEIIEIAKSYGLTSDYVRPERLASDECGKLDVIIDVLKYEEHRSNISFDLVLDLDVTAPLRTIEDLNDAIGLLQKDDNALNIFSVSPPHRNPYYNMVEKKEDGYVKLVKPLDKSILSRQKAPQVYDMNASFYVYKKDFFALDFKSALTDRSLAFIMDHICFDIDHELDYVIMEYLVSTQKIDFDFGR